MTTERQTFLRAKAIVINRETQYVQELMDESSSLVEMGVDPTKLLGEMERESARLNPEGHVDEEEIILRGLKKK